MTRTTTLFLRQFVKSPRTVGAVIPSSPALARAMLAPIDFAAVRTIVEFGPGTGALTREIAARLPPQCRYLGIELNPRFVHSLAAAFPRLDFAHGSAADLAQILAVAWRWAGRCDRVRPAVGDAADLAAGPGVRRNGPWRWRQEVCL